MEYENVNLRELRKKSGLSTAELARLTGVSESTIKRYEMNSSIRSSDSFEKACKVCYSVSGDVISEAGSRVRECREQMGMSRAEFAELCGIPLSNLYEIENGDQKVTGKTAKKIENNCGVGGDWIIYGLASDKEFPVSDKLIEWLRSDAALREELWARMKHYEALGQPLQKITLKEQRLSLELTQSQVAERAGITLQQYQKFESGQRELMNASFRIACRVLRALKIDAKEYFITND